MKNSQYKPVSFASTWIQKAGIIGLTGILCLACTPTAAPPTGNEETETNPQAVTETTESNTPVQVAPASVPMNRPTTAGAAEESCQKMMAIVSDPNPPTNIRSTPEVTDNNIVGQVDNGTRLSVKDEQDDWFQVSTRGDETLEGWVAKSVTKSGCSQKTQRITIPSDSNSVTISDRFIGSGSHEYILNVQAGQTITVTSESSPFPFIFAPDDPNRQQELSNQGGSPGPISWTSELSTSGDYVLDMQSNFRGYEYSFAVELK